MGRKPALDEVKRGQVCAMIALGCSRRTAARYVGCATSTIRHTALHDRQFREQLRRAELKAEIAPLQNLQNHAAKSWRAAAWLLERTRPDEYARISPETMTVKAVHEIIGLLAETIIDEIPSEEAKRRLQARVQDRLADLLKERHAAGDPLLDGRRAPKQIRSAHAAIDTAPASAAVQQDASAAVQQSPDSWTKP